MNSGDFGGAIFIETDENVESKRNDGIYLLNQAQFVGNEAEEGGAVYVVNGRKALGERSFNAQRFVLRLLECLFERNRCDSPSQNLVQSADDIIAGLEGMGAHSPLWDPPPRFDRTEDFDRTMPVQRAGLH